GGVGGVVACVVVEDVIRGDVDVIVPLGGRRDGAGVGNGPGDGDAAAHDARDGGGRVADLEGGRRQRDLARRVAVVAATVLSQVAGSAGDDNDVGRAGERGVPERDGPGVAVLAGPGGQVPTLVEITEVLGAT